MHIIKKGHQEVALAKVILGKNLLDSDLNFSKQCTFKKYKCVRIK